MSKYEPTSSGFREVDDQDKDKAAITETVTPSKKVSGTEEESPADKKSKAKKGKKGTRKDEDEDEDETHTDTYSPTEGGRKKSYPKNVGAEGGASGRRLALETNQEIPYPQLGGHTVSQLYNMETHKRKSILGEKDDEFVAKYF